MAIDFSIGTTHDRAGSRISGRMQPDAPARSENVIHSIAFGRQPDPGIFEDLVYNHVIGKQVTHCARLNP
jgi:hypothetical protein